VSFISSRYASSTFGEYIRAARLKKGLRQKDVAKLIGSDPQTITNWEKASEVPNRYQRVKTLCEAVDLEYEKVLQSFCPLWAVNEGGFGRVLARGRISRGLTLKELAKLGGVDPATLKRWEQSDRTPGLGMQRKARRILVVLGIDESEALGCKNRGQSERQGLVR